MASLELTTRAYWSTALALLEKQEPADRQLLEGTMAMIAAKSSGRVAVAAARRLEQLADDGPEAA